MAVKIVTDSTAALPSELVQELGITVIPQNLHFGEETFLDGVDMDDDTLNRRRWSIAPTQKRPMSWRR